jgi:hypothetical protein
MGIDLWIRGKEVYKVSMDLKNHLPQLGRFYLADLFDEDRASGGFPGWFSAQDLRLQGGLSREWNSFRKALVTACIKIRNDHDSLVWYANPKEGNW